MAETNGSSPVSPETKEKVWSCKDCKIKFPDVYKYTEHLESKDHVKGVMKNKYGEKYLAAKAQLDMKSTNEKPETPKPDEKEAKPTDSNDSCQSSDEDEEVYPCEVCKKVCTGLVSYKLHLEGRKHNKMLKKIKLLSEMKKQKVLPEPDDNPKEESLLDKIMTKNHYASSDIVCQVCDKTCTGPEVYKQHCKSKSHMKKLLTKDVVKGIDSLGFSPTSKENEESENFRCKVCEKGFSGPIPYIQHLESTVHLKQAKHVEEFDKIKDLIVTKDEDSKFQCKECGKMFSGPIPFKTHLNSSVHGKMKKKSALLESLGSQHPEMIQSSPALNSDDDDADVLLGCEVCHMAFSGPEVARDHFGSMKHKKAAKRKILFQKYKKQQKLLTKPGVNQKRESAVSKNSNGSNDSESDDFDIISNPESYDIKN